MNIRAILTRTLNVAQRATRTDMRYVAKGGSWWLLGKGGTLLISVATLAAFSRFVPQETFGAYRYVLATISIIGIAALPGMGGAVTRAVARGNKTALTTAAKTRLKWGLLGSIGALAVAGWYYFNGNTEFAAAFTLASFLFPLPRIFNLQERYWQGKKRFSKQSAYKISFNAMEAAVFIPVLALTNNLILIVAAYLISRSIFRGIFYFRTLREATYSKTTQEANTAEADKNADGEMVSFGKHLTVMQVIGRLAGQLDKVLTWQFLGPNAIAVYSFAEMPAKRLRKLMPIGPLALPKLSEKEDVRRVKNNILHKCKLLLLLALPLAGVLALVAPWIYQVLFPQYMESVPYFRAMTLLILLLPTQLLISSLKAAMAIRHLYALNVAPPAIKIVLMLALIPLWGLWGLIFAVLAGEFAKGGLSLYLLIRL